ncbi:unnamed protein product [Rotaria sp. Silwood1]|nr:unnamed protein product [Rotaria sp. Silwood1]CAF1313176.1 unnamed protein product [Rotaria sp. Silwood1]CAF3378781.1 unnamed protein product [Rotaria sp. Silwood1]CAF3544321.1 unnamed protein product [Rotaria sp. Silwood1]CAF4750305.1 unnamed protein product [Rotaria sp. Silwood1]
MSLIHDIIIIGGGIVGLGVFRQLTLNGYKDVLLLDKSSQILTGASSGNSGILHTGFDTIPETLESKLVKRGYELYQSFAQDIKLPIKKIGAYIIAWKSDELETLKQILDTAHKNGVTDIEEISPTTLYEREPHLRANALNALYIPGECIVDPLTLPLILYMQSKLLGGYVQMNTEIINGKYDLEKKYWLLNDGQFKSRIVINCAGLYGDYIEQIRINQQVSSTSTFTIQPRIGQFSVYSSSISELPIKSIILPLPTKFTKGIIIYPNLFNQIIIGPTAETQHDRSQAPIKSDINNILYNKINELIPTFSKLNYQHIGSYTGIRPATEYSDYQIHSYNDLQWICCGGIRSTGLSSSLAIGEYICNKLNEMINIKHEIVCEGYSSERYYQSLEQLKSMFSLTLNGLQPNLIVNESKVLPTITGDIKLGDNMKSLNLKIDCAGEIFDISHSLLKLAWITKRLE